MVIVIRHVQQDNMHLIIQDLDNVLPVMLLVNCVKHHLKTVFNVAQDIGNKNLKLQICVQMHVLLQHKHQIMVYAKIV